MLEKIQGGIQWFCIFQPYTVSSLVLWELVLRIGACEELTKYLFREYSWFCLHSNAKSFYNKGEYVFSFVYMYQLLYSQKALKKKKNKERTSLSSF